MMSDWNNDVALTFLEVYKGQPILWDPKQSLYKDKRATHEAWNRIAKMMEKPVTELKRKKDSLMASYRHHLRKRKTSLASSSRYKKVYKPSWFAFEAMDQFLSPISKCQPTCSTDEDPTHHMQADDLIEVEEGLGLDDRPPTPPTVAPPPKQRVQSQRRRSSQPQRVTEREPERPEASNRTNQVLETLNNIMDQKRTREDDDCDLYGKLLAKKLRKIPEDERAELMYKIDGLLINRARRNDACRPGSSHSSPSS